MAMGLLVAYLLQVAMKMKMTQVQEMTWHGVETSNQKKIKDTDLIVNTTPHRCLERAGLESRFSSLPLAGLRSTCLPLSLGPFSSHQRDKLVHSGNHRFNMNISKHI